MHTAYIPNILFSLYIGYVSIVYLFYASYAFIVHSLCIHELNSTCYFFHYANVVQLLVARFMRAFETVRKIKCRRRATKTPLGSFPVKQFSSMNFSSDKLRAYHRRDLAWNFEAGSPPSPPPPRPLSIRLITTLITLLPAEVAQGVTIRPWWCVAVF